MLDAKLGGVWRASVGTVLYHWSLIVWFVIACGVLGHTLVAVGAWESNSRIDDYRFGGMILAVTALTWIVSRYSHCIVWMPSTCQITKESDPNIYNIASEQAQLAGLPLPKVYEIKSDSLNAHVISRSPRDVIVAITSAFRCKLDPLELGAVLAHEMAHVKNRDGRVTAVAVTFVGSVLGTSILAGYYGWVGAIGLLPLAASWLGEFRADMTAARVCGNPIALTSALRKLHGSGLRDLLGDLWPIRTHPPTRLRTFVLRRLAKRKA